MDKTSHKFSDESFVHILEFIVNRKSLVASILGASFVLAGLLATPAAAYPPGTNLNLSASREVADWDNPTAPIDFTVTNAGSSKVYVWVNGKKSFSRTPVAGSTSFTRSLGKVGRTIITTVVGSEKKTVYIYRPTKPVVYSTQKISKGFLIKTKGAKPGTPFIVRVNGSVVMAREANNGGFGTLYVSAYKLRKGNNSVEVILGQSSLEKNVVGFK